MYREWSEVTIRNEISRLDTITGLAGAKLPISFSNAKRTLGQYSCANGGSFRFSNFYFQDKTWPVEEAVDVIRHEYAHYMDHMLYGNLGHGATWKHCCVIVGALPIRCYDEARAKYHQQKHEEESNLNKHLDRYNVGDWINHPQFGHGIIENIQGDALGRFIVVRFDTVGTKKLSLVWVNSNCRRHD